MDLSRFGLHLPRILLPQASCNMTQWAVLSCDQYTSQPTYWEKAAQLVGDAPSTLHMIQPEVYLDHAQDRVTSVTAHMQTYLEEGILQDMGEGLMYIERATMAHPCRRGLVAAIDLDAYTYGEGSAGLIRATEGVVMSRIPPRLAIRAQAPLELPHVMLLVDDPQDLLMTALSQVKDSKAPIYDFPLMLQGGSIKGWHIQEESLLAKAEEALDTLLCKATQQNPLHPMLIAVGDGNHSLVTAKCHWEAIKPTLSAQAQKNHPARYALCEIGTLYDAGLDFEPIHRVIFGVNPQEMIHAIEAWAQAHQSTGGTCQSVQYQYGDSTGCLHLGHMPTPLEEASLQDCFDALLPHFPGASIDYIHGDAAVKELVTDGEALGLYMPPFPKEELFPYVQSHGVLPRKTFSMGHADEKRFYLECRRITE